MTAPALVLIGHGSRDPEGNLAFQRFADGFARDAGRGCHVGFIDHAEPTLDQALERAARDAEDLTVVPVILFAAGHVKHDVPRAVGALRARRPGLRVSCAPPVGLHGEMVDLLEGRVRAAPGGQAPDAGTAVLLMGRGSSDPDANGDCVKLGRLLWERLRVPLVETCFIGITRPSLPEGLERCARLGARRILVLPYLLFTGILHKRVARILAEFSRGRPDVALVQLDELGDGPELRRVVAGRIRSTEAPGGEP